MNWINLAQHKNHTTQYDSTHYNLTLHKSTWYDMTQQNKYCPYFFWMNWIQLWYKRVQLPSVGLPGQVVRGNRGVVHVHCHIGDGELIWETTLLLCLKPLDLGAIWTVLIHVDWKRKLCTFFTWVISLQYSHAITALWWEIKDRFIFTLHARVLSILSWAHCTIVKITSLTSQIKIRIFYTVHKIEILKEY